MIGPRPSEFGLCQHVKEHRRVVVSNFRQCKGTANKKKKAPI